MLSLSSHGRCMLLLCSRIFFRCGARRYPTFAAVIADFVFRGVVGYGLVVNIVNVRVVHVIHRAVVVKLSVIPISTFIAETSIAEAVVDATVEADVRTPVAAIPSKANTAPTPITGSPEQANCGRR